MKRWMQQRWKCSTSLWQWPGRTGCGTSERQSESGRCCGDKAREARLRWFGGTVNMSVEGCWGGRRRIRGRPKSAFMDVVNEDMKWVDVRGGCRWLAVATTEGNNQRRRVFWFHCSCSEAGHDLDTVQNEKKKTCQLAKHLLNECRLQAWTCSYWQVVWTWSYGDIQAALDVKDANIKFDSIMLWCILCTFSSRTKTHSWMRVYSLLQKITCNFTFSPERGICVLCDITKGTFSELSVFQCMLSGRQS